MEALGWTILVLVLIAIALYIFGIIDIVKGTFRGDSEKAIWLIIVLIFPILGVLIYLLFGRQRRKY